MHHSLTWREHTRAGSIGIQSAYRQGLRSCRDITTWVEHCPRTEFGRSWSTPHASARYSDDRRIASRSRKQLNRSIQRRRQRWADDICLGLRSTFVTRHLRRSRLVLAHARTERMLLVSALVTWQKEYGGLMNKLSSLSFFLSRLAG